MKLSPKEAYALRQALASYGLWCKYTDKSLEATSKQEREDMEGIALDFRKAMNKRFREAFDTDFSEICFVSAEYERNTK